MIAAIRAVRDAVKAQALADPAVAAAIADRLHDRTPDAKDNPVYPFAAMGPKRAERLETGADDPGRRVTLRLYTASRDFESDEAWDVAQLLADALEGATPDLAAPWLLVEPIRVVLMGDAQPTGAPRQVFVDVATTLVRA